MGSGGKAKLWSQEQVQELRSGCACGCGEPEASYGISAVLQDIVMLDTGQCVFVKKHKVKYVCAHTETRCHFNHCSTLFSELKHLTERGTDSSSLVASKPQGFFFLPP